MNNLTGREAREFKAYKAKQLRNKRLLHAFWTVFGANLFGGLIGGFLYTSMKQGGISESTTLTISVIVGLALATFVVYVMQQSVPEAKTVETKEQETG